MPAVDPWKWTVWRKLF